MKTTWRIRKDKKDADAYDLYLKLMEEPDAMKTAVIEAVMDKCNIGSAATVYAIIKREKARRNDQ